MESGEEAGRVRISAGLAVICLWGSGNVMNFPLESKKSIPLRPT